MAKPIHRDSQALISSEDTNSRSLLGLATRKSRRRGGSIGDGRRGSTGEEGSNTSSLSASEPVEMDDIDSDFGDEEQGLTAKDRRGQAPRRFHSHDAADVPLTQMEKRLADRAVIKKIIINVILIGLWYLFATSISVYNKWMFSPDRLDFHFPLFTTSLHMLVQFGLASSILFLFPHMRPSRRPAGYSALPENVSESTEKPLVTPKFYITQLLPCGVATALDIGLGNTSLKFITLTFLTMCKSSALAFVLLFAFLFRLETPSWKLILIIATMTVGVVMMVAGEASFNAIGFSLIIASAFFSGFRWALTQILLLRHPATANPFSTQFFIAPIEFVSLIILAAGVEGPAAVFDGIRVLVEKEGVFLGIGLLIIPGILAFCMISAEFALLQRTNVVTLSICGIFKEVVTISVAEMVYHDPLTPINISGLLVTIASIGGYNYLKITKMRREERERLLDAESEEADAIAKFGTAGEAEEREGLVQRRSPLSSPPLDELPAGSNRVDSPAPSGLSSRSNSPPKRPQDHE